MAISKKEALSIVCRCAQKYKQELINHSLLFICLDKNKRTYAVEVTFDASNFQHLTGLQTHKQGISPKDFFHRCIEQRLSENDFDFAEDGTTPLKLEVLPVLIRKDLSANMIGNYNGMQAKLFTDKLAGNVRACMGFKKIGNAGRYVPNTVLNGRTGSFTDEEDRIIITYRKAASDSQYSEIVHTAKEIAWQNIHLPKGYESLPLPENEK